MFKLIQSQNREMKEVLSGGKVVWVLEDDGTTSFTSKVFITTFRSSANIRNLPEDFDYFKYRGVRVNKKDITRVVSSLSRTNHKEFIEKVVANGDYGKSITLRFYKKVGGVILNRLPRLFANIVLPKAVA